MIDNKSEVFNGFLEFKMEILETFNILKLTLTKTAVPIRFLSRKV
jgi:hypothetical protein